VVSIANPEFYQFYFVHEHFQRFLTRVHGRYQPFWYFIPILALGLFPWSLFLLQAVKHNVPTTWRERHEHRDALFLLLWAGLVFLFFSASSSKLVPYILPVFPPLALLIGRYLAAAWDSRDFPGLRAGYAAVLVTSLLLAGAFLGLPYYWPTPAAQTLGVYRYTIAFALAIGSAATWGLMRYRGLKWAFVALAVTSALFLTQVNAAAPRIDIKSVKKLAIELKAHLKPGDEVASYGEYYQDLPVYLERRITVVNWGGELNFGNSVEDTSAWMTDGATFWKRWQGPATIYVLTPIEDYETLKRSDPDLPLFPIARDERNIVFSNREVKP
jgi:4-amino-4-deoxy-L-arabinose transferase-like glycosyltransferase